MKFVPNTIRSQIMTVFLSCFVFMGVIIALNYNNFRSLSRSMQFFEIAEELNNNLLEFSRASHPKVENVDLEEIVDKTARLVNNEMKLNNIRFAKQIESGLPRVRLDKGGL